MGLPETITVAATSSGPLDTAATPTSVLWETAASTTLSVAIGARREHMIRRFRRPLGEMGSFVRKISWVGKVWLA